MSFTDVVGGNLGQLNNQFQANLGQNAAMNQNQQASMAAQQQAAAAQQAQLNALYGPQGFGGQTAQYAAAGAAYGRNTGGFGGLGAANADPFTPVPGGTEDQQWYLGGSVGPRPSSVQQGPASPSGTVTSGGDMPGYQLDPTPGVGAGGGYDPYATQNPFGGAADQAWYLGGSHGDRPSSFEDRFNAAPAVDYNLQGSPSPIPRGILDGNFNTQMPNSPPASIDERFNVFGGPADIQWMQGGSQGDRPSDMARPGWGGAADVAWMQGGSQGQRPSLMASGGDTSWLGAGGTQNPYNPFGQINSGMVFGGPQDIAWMLAGSQGQRPSQMGGIGSDATHDPYGWQLAQSSPYATPSNVPSSPTANLGYNPGMANYFANPGMQTSNVDTSQSAINAATQQMQSLKDWYDQLMFDPNFRQVGSDVPPLPGRGGYTPFVNSPGG